MIRKVEKIEIEKNITMGGSAFPDTERLSELEYQRIVSQVKNAKVTVSIMGVFFKGFRVAEENES